MKAAIPLSALTSEQKYTTFLEEIEEKEGKIIDTVILKRNKVEAEITIKFK